jgi:quinolinate synthase
MPDGQARLMTETAKPLQKLPPRSPLAYTDEIARETAPLYEKMARVVPALEWPLHAPYVAAINRLKRERDAVILAHNYQAPEIYFGVADIVGDSLQLAREATKTKAKLIVQAGVYFMAETSKILNPEKTVIIPDTAAGCSLASSVTAADVRLLRQKYPGVPIVTYVNSSAEVKAESDICCTSANAVRIVESRGAPKVIMLPDQYLAKYVASQTKVEIITWAGQCEVHERFTGAELRAYRARHPGVTILAHPECPPDVLAEADFAGSTAAMISYVENKQPPKVVMVTECSMADNVAAANPAVEFVRPCNLCPHMKRITLPKILQALETLSPEVIVDAEVAVRAKRAVDAMLAVM